MTHAPGVTGTPDAQRLQAELQFVTELCEIVASNSELQPILDWIVHKTTGLLSADEGSIKLLAPEMAGSSVKTIIRRETPGLSSGSWPQAVSMSVMGFLLHRGEALASPDLPADPRFPGLRGGGGRVRAVLAVPLKVGNHITGMLAVTDAQPGREWTQHDAQLLAIVASNSAGVIEQARLRVEALEKQRLEEENRRMDRELEQARQIQMRLVPTEPLTVGPWRADGRVVPARMVGGDAFNYRELGEGRLGVSIADVSGKGVPAALLMANLQASLWAFCNGRRPIREAIRFINESVVRSAAGGKFITFFYGEIDPAAGTLSYVNAGHNFPMVRRRNGEVDVLREGGLPLGILEDADYEQGVVAFGPGESLMMYSDGLSEATDLGQNEFGEDRLRTLWGEHGARPPHEVIDLMLERISDFRGRASQSDDMTVVVVGARPA
ncbi:MAG: GAF domain-containing protein [Candidatus Eisenbacteria bacterium]|uniref:GAF domain-containing protein n=1 Tax=Eiseniibacteriota bacterium TaxID=2212470 RepID=A0A538S9L1_UNCEI|nr:MAG: GAF domain-containing protein [Candidatus Eisenbacteria bacterium]